jgi:hypothetical protein
MVADAVENIQIGKAKLYDTAHQRGGFSAQTDVGANR